MRQVVSGLGVVLVVTILIAVAAGGATAAPRTSQYLVVFKSGHSGQGVKAVKQAGGKILGINKIGVGTVSSVRADFAARLRATGRVSAVARHAAWRQASVGPARSLQTAELTPSEAITGCNAFFTPQAGTVGPDPLNVCQWGNRSVKATIGGGSYGFNQGDGVKIGIIDTGLDLVHEDIRPNLNVALSCSFIRPGNPTALPQEVDATNFPSGANGPFSGACATKSAVQDYNGHGTHVGGTAAAPINGLGISGIAPRATLVGLKAGSAQGFFFTQEVVDALVYAGDKGIDVVNMSFFADPWLFNCRGAGEQQAIIKAISRASSYAAQRGVVQVSSAGNELIDMDHPPDQDEDSPNFPPGSSVPRDIGNNCVILPHELPNVATITAIGPRHILASYSNTSNSKVENTAPGGDAGQSPGFTWGRILSSYSSTAPAFPASRSVVQCTGPGGTPPCFRYVWLSGTSMAAPHASGVAALIRRNHPGLPALAVIAMLQRTAQPMACTPAAEAYTGRDCTGNTNPASSGQTNFYGNGLVDALLAGTS